MYLPCGGILSGVNIPILIYMFYSVMQAVLGILVIVLVWGGRHGLGSRLRFRNGIESLLDQDLDRILWCGRFISEDECDRLVGRSTFWSLKSFPPRARSSAWRTFFREIVARSAVARMPSMIEVYCATSSEVTAESSQLRGHRR